MMNEKLDMTQKLGDAFLGQQKEVLAAIQQLRAKAQAAGNLKSSKEQTVTTAQEAGTTVIKIEPAESADVVYVPTYNPTVVYGPWPYPAYPPYYLLPAGLRAGRGAVLVRRRARRGLRAVGQLQLGRRQREHQRQQVQQLQQDQHPEQQLAAQRRAPQGRAVPRFGEPAEVRQGPARGTRLRASSSAAAPSRGGRTSPRGGADRFKGGGDRGGVVTAAAWVTGAASVTAAVWVIGGGRGGVDRGGAAVAWAIAVAQAVASVTAAAQAVASVIAAAQVAWWRWRCGGVGGGR